MHTPAAVARRARAIPAGAVGIGGEQTGIYPDCESRAAGSCIGPHAAQRCFAPASGTLPYAAGDARSASTPIDGRQSLNGLRQTRGGDTP
ncbi:MAG: hypothetical protein ACLVB5_01005 [Christensenellales bacterium]